MYQKEIIYMGLFRDDLKEKNAGYLKVDKRESTYRLELQIKNISGSITGNYPIRLQSETGWQEADSLAIKEGNGKWSGSIAEPVLRAEVILSDVQKISGESRLAKKEEPKEKMPDRAAGLEEQQEKWQSERTGEESAARKPQPKRTGGEPAARKLQSEKTEEGLSPGKWQSERTGEESAARKPQPERTGGEPSPGKWQSETGEEGPPSGNPWQRAGQKPVMQAESMYGVDERNDSPMRQVIKAERIAIKPEHTPLYENKWEQLLTTYERIHPYGDNRVYVKLAPKDFIILRENYQHLVNNSFLLHGFYNYRYLILGKEKDFYLGVPGVFYEREKMVALMFGFEAFECEGGKAEEGKFGYYLRKVEL